MNGVDDYRDEENCPAADVLLRVHDGDATPAEAESVERHLAGCEACRADVDSIEFIELEMLLADADARALRAFPPDAAHAGICRRLDEDSLRRLCEAPPRPEDEDLCLHIARCSYCRRRLFRVLAERETAGDLRLRDRIIGAMMEAPVAEAGRRVAGMTAWREDEAAELAGWELLDRLRVWSNESGALFAAGMEDLMSPGGPSPDYLGPDGKDAGARTWAIPLAEPEAMLTLSLAAAEEEGQWRLGCRLTGGAAPDPAAETRVEIGPESETPISTGFTRNLAELLDGTNVALFDGAWQITLRTDDDVRRIRITLGLGAGLS